MNSRIQMLAALFGLQLLLVAGFLYLDVSGSAEAAPDFLAYSADSVDRLVIGGDGDEVEMTSTDEGWELSGGTPADADKIADVLEKLQGLSAPWPVATSADSRERFEVTEESNQRHIRLFAGEEAVAELYLGTSPGYRRVHARVAGADEVYSIDFSSFEVPVGQDDWLDKDLLKAAGEVTRVEREGEWMLSKADDGWLLGAVAPAQSAAEQAAADNDAAKKIIERFADLRVTGFAPEDANLTDKGVFNVSDGSGSHRLRFYHDEAEDSYAVESDRMSGRFAVPAYIAEQVIVAETDLRRVEAPAGENLAEAE